MVISGIYSIQYSQVFSVSNHDKTQLPALAHNDPPNAKVVKMRINCIQLTPHFFLNCSNIVAKIG
jgi:hypothetical protein